MKKNLLMLLMAGLAIMGTSCSKKSDPGKVADQTISLGTNNVFLDIAPRGISPQEVEISSAVATTDLDALIKRKLPGYGLKNLKSLKIKTMTLKQSRGTDNVFSCLAEENILLEIAGKTFKTANYTGPVPPNFNPDLSNSFAVKIELAAENSIDVKDLINTPNIKYTFKSKVINPILKQLGNGIVPDSNIGVDLIITYEAVVGL